MQDGHSCPSLGHETLPKRRLLWLDSRSIMRRSLANFSDMNVQATGIAATNTSHFCFSGRCFAHAVAVGGADVVGDDEFGEQAEGQCLAAEE